MTTHSIIHVEIPAANREASVKFYRDVFGWNAADMPNIPYPMFEAGGVTGGFPDVNDMYKPGDVIIHVNSEDIQADLKNIEVAGGKSITGVIDLGPGGAVAFLLIRRAIDWHCSKHLRDGHASDLTAAELNSLVGSLPIEECRTLV